MNDADFTLWSVLSFQNFVSEMAKSTGKHVDEIIAEVGKGPSKMSPDDLWLVVEKDNADVGFVWIKLNSDDQSAFGFDIWLAEEVRGQGVGRGVITAGWNLLRERGIKRLRICVFDGNAVARRLYESLGFYLRSYDPTRKQHHLEMMIS